MALVARYEAQTGVIFSKAYFRVVQVMHNVQREIVVAGIAVYKDEKARRDERAFVEYREVTLSREDHDQFFTKKILEQDGVTSIGQIYRWLKSSHPDYKEYTDV